MDNTAENLEREEQEQQGGSVDRDGFWLRLARDANTSSSNFFDANVRSRIINDIRQFQGEHPEGSKYFTDSYRLKSKLFRPKTRATIRKNEAIAAGAFFSTEDVVSVRPQDMDDTDQLQAARFQKELLQLRLTRPHPQGLPWFLTCQGAYQEAQTVGVVASFQRWSFNEVKKVDRPDVQLLPVENVRFDPAADWRDVVNTSPYLVIHWPMYLKDVRAKMRPQGETQEPEWRTYGDGEILSASRQSDTIRQAREGNGTDSKQANTAANDFTVVWVHQNFVEVQGRDVFYYTLGTERMLTEPRFTDDEYPQGRPVVIGFAVVEAHKVYPSSLPTLTRDTQAEINDLANKRIDNINLILNKRYFVRRNKNVDLRSLTRNSPASVTLMDEPNTDVKTITTDDATRSSYEEQDRLNLDFDDVSGVFSGSSVASNRQLNETVGGMELLTANANQVSEYQLRTFTETWVEPVLRQLLILEQVHESDRDILTAAAQAAGLDRQNLSDEIAEAMLLLPSFLTVNVGIGAINPQMQLQRFVAAMKLLSEILGENFLTRPLREGEREIVKEVFGKSGYRDGSRFIPQQKEEENPEVTQLRQMVEELQRRLEMKTPPELLAAQVEKEQATAEEKRASASLKAADTALKKVEAVTERVEALYSAMNTAQTAVQVPGVAPVADEIARSAGFEDADGGGIYPEGAPVDVPQEARIPENTSPMHPANPGRGMMAGIESGETPAVPQRQGAQQIIEQGPA